ncbi:sensor histidine kinase [Flavobacterium sp. LaA7.5]|nr:sensor histidine kinase [Flavobacterium salilacus subsp. altitudinum]
MKYLFHSIAVLLNLLVFSAAFSQNSKQLLKLQDKLYSDNSREFENALKKIDSSSLSPQDKALYYYIYAKHLELDNQDGKAYEYLRDSRRLYVTMDSLDKAMEINLDIVYLLQSQEHNNLPYKHYIEEYITHAEKIKDTLKIARGYGTMATYFAYKNDYNISANYYKKGLNLIKDKHYKNVESAFYNNLANLYNENLHQPDSGIYYLKKKYIILKESNAPPEGYYHYYINLAASYHHKKDFITANKHLKSADSLPIENYELKSKLIIYNNFYKNYAELNDYENAYKYLLLTKQYNDSIKATEQNIAINDIHTKYKTKEKELENQILRGDVKTKQVINYVTIGLLIAGSVIAFLIIKNARKKEKISHQEKLIEKQKLEKALKEYELNSIDIMLEGQEKERQRIANELHDNLGSMLATLKINFENLKLRKSEINEDENRLYQKTDDLIEEAYQKVRRLAHAKNAGVYASEGLIPALKKLVQKVSIPKKLKVDFIPYGFNERLDNSQEITIFRIVQELITNIIKHAQATEASIQLTHHDDLINIIIEDNGVGFSTDKMNAEDGMGIAAIQKKTEQLGGSFIIDSTPGKGTTILIDLPI